MTTHPRQLTRSQVLAFRRRSQSLDRRMQAGPQSLRRAAWAGCKDSMPRAALLSLHARVEGIHPGGLDAPPLTQVWGPGFHAYVVAEDDVGVFTLGRLPEGGPRREMALEMAGLLDSLLDEGPMTYREAGAALGVDPNRLRYATLTGTVTLHWGGAGPPEISRRPAPDIDPAEAAHELGRRYLHVLGPGTAAGFGSWAGIRPDRAERILAGIGPELVPVRTPIGDSWLLASDEAALTEPDGSSAGARLLPSGDAYVLLWGPDRELLVPDARRRSELWTSRVWPGALLVDGEVAGTWRRAGARLSLAPWRPLAPRERASVEDEVAALPLDEQPLQVTWAAP